MTKTPATVALDRAGVWYTVREYDHRAQVAAQAGGFGLEAAQALGVTTDRVFKTLLVTVDKALVVCVVPVSAMVDLKAVAATFQGKKATMADPAQAARATGYVVGGISPVGQRRRLPTALDESAVGHRTILVSGGRRGMDIELAPGDLAAVTGALVTRVATR